MALTKALQKRIDLANRYIKFAQKHDIFGRGHFGSTMEEVFTYPHLITVSPTGRSVRVRYNDVYGKGKHSQSFNTNDPDSVSDLRYEMTHYVIGAIKRGAKDEGRSIPKALSNPRKRKPYAGGKYSVILTQSPLSRPWSEVPKSGVVKRGFTWTGDRADYKLKQEKGKDFFYAYGFEHGTNRLLYLGTVLTPGEGFERIEYFDKVGLYIDSQGSPQHAQDGPNGRAIKLVAAPLGPLPRKRKRSNPRKRKNATFMGREIENKPVYTVVLQEKPPGGHWRFMHEVEYGTTSLESALRTAKREANDRAKDEQGGWQYRTAVYKSRKTDGQMSERPLKVFRPSKSNPRKRKNGSKSSHGFRYPKGKHMAKSWAQIMREYERKEDRNDHSGNYLMIAEALGRPEKVLKELRSIKRERDRRGLDLAQTQRQHQLTKGDYARAMKYMKAEKSRNRKNPGHKREVNPYSKRYTLSSFTEKFWGKNWRTVPRDIRRSFWDDFKYAFVGGLQKYKEFTRG